MDRPVTLLERKIVMSKDITKKTRLMCYRCDKIFKTNRSPRSATCPFCKAVPCTSCGKTHHIVGGIDV